MVEGILVQQMRLIEDEDGKDPLFCELLNMHRDGIEDIARGIRAADQRWLNEEWFPEILAAGVRFMAIVVPKSAVARLSARQILSKVDSITVVTNHFDDIEAARAWLRTV